MGCITPGSDVPVEPENAYPDTIGHLRIAASNWLVVLKAVGMATTEQQRDASLDHRGERRLSGRESAVWYTVAAVSYIAIGTWQKVLLTWFIGPMWLVATLTFGPRIYDRLRGRQEQTK